MKGQILQASEILRQRRRVDPLVRAPQARRAFERSIVRQRHGPVAMLRHRMSYEFVPARLAVLITPHARHGHGRRAVRDREVHSWQIEHEEDVLQRAEIPEWVFVGLAANMLCSRALEDALQRADAAWRIGC